MPKTEVTKDLLQRMNSPSSNDGPETISVRINKSCIPILEHLKKRKTRKDGSLGRVESYGEVATALIHCANELLEEMNGNANGIDEAESSRKQGGGS